MVGQLFHDWKNWLAYKVVNKALLCALKNPRVSCSEPLFANTASYVALANWRPAEGFSEQVQGRPLCLGVSLRGIANSISDAHLTYPGTMWDYYNKSTHPTPPRTWRRRAGGQLKTWATTIKTDLEPISGPWVFGHARWRKDWVKVSSELAQDRRAWSASVRDVVNAIGDAGSTRPGWMPTQSKKILRFSINAVINIGFPELSPQSEEF